MSELYSKQHRELQDEFDSRRIADRIEQLGHKTQLDEPERGFIANADMFFLATVDDRGRPTVSYKGGDPGFVKVLNGTTLMFPSYDGNGMFLSTGNILGYPQVGMLFISFERPHRIRVQGTAAILRDPAVLSEFPGAELVVQVGVEHVWPNCPRYIHRYQKVSASRYVPRDGCEAPLAEWKRVDLVQDALPARDAEKAARSGTISIEEWVQKVQAGDSTA